MGAAVHLFPGSKTRTVNNPWIDRRSLPQEISVLSAHREPQAPPVFPANDLLILLLEALPQEAWTKLITQLPKAELDDERFGAVRTWLLAISSRRGA